jgi:hypothetical protein
LTYEGKTSQTLFIDIESGYRMDVRKVKGTMLVDQVRMIRGNKELDWDEYLKPEDWEVIGGRILVSEWYPLEIYQRCGWATYKLLALGNLELVRLRGRIRGQELFEGIYNTIIVNKTPEEAIKRFIGMYVQLFNFSTLKLEEAGRTYAKLSHHHDSLDPANTPYVYQLMGHLDRLTEMAGGENVEIALSDKEWEGAAQTIFNITWT